SAYEFLRRVEHRLQMINDEQTHALPDDPAALAHLAVFLGFADTGAFSTTLLHHLHRVEAHYAELFEDAPTLTASELGGNLVFTGGEPDPETRATLVRLGFAKPEMVDAAVRGWHHGRCRAMRSPRARELLTELMPFLLKALADAPDPDAAFVTFDRFLNSLPAGVQLFSMFHARPELLRLVIHVMGVAPGLATTLARRPAVLESVLAADFFREPPSTADLQIELDGALARARDHEEMLDLSRRWAAERNFQVGVLSLNRLIGTSEAQIAWSNVADAAVRALLPRVQAEFAKIHGWLTCCDLAVVAMGKLGSREMTVGSDLDLIFVYTTPAPDKTSDGPRPLPASQYFARLSQRFINALTAPTAEGRLYEVDMRLRPSGKAGPIATSLASYQRYHEEESWTWEQMALTRARVIAGPPTLTVEIDRSIRAALTRRRDADALRADVADMRARIERERRARSLWDVKYVRGGLVDIEFIAQYLQLRHAHDAPQVLSTNTMDALNALAAAGVLAPNAADELIEALGLWQQIQARLRLAFADPLAAESEEGVKVLHEAFRDIAGPDMASLTSRMEVTAAAVLARFREIVGDSEAVGEATAGRAAG
ncbi:MAG: [protein-PII] uridylyltransferase family protein, partial [Rhodospirillales bacterium]